MFIHGNFFFFMCLFINCFNILGKVSFKSKCCLCTCLVNVVVVKLDRFLEGDVQKICFDN